MPTLAAMKKTVKVTVQPVSMAVLLINKILIPNLFS